MVVVPPLKITAPAPLMLEVELSVATISSKSSVAPLATVKGPVSVPPGSSR